MNARLPAATPRIRLHAFLVFKIACLLFSETDREAELNGVFVRAVAGQGAALEGRVLVVEQPLDVLVQVPVEAHAPRVCLAGRGQRIREGVSAAREGLVTDGQ